MSSTGRTVVLVSFLFIIIGSVVLVVGSLLPSPPIYSLVIGFGCIIIAIIILVWGLCAYQREMRFSYES